MKTITDSPYCLNVFLRSHLFDLLADIADMYVQCLCLTHIRLIPGIFENILFTENLFWISKQ